MSTAIKGPDLMKPGEVREAFSVSALTVTRWRKAGKLATVRTPGGRFFRFYRAEVEAILRGTPLTPEQVAALREQAGGRP